MIDINDFSHSNDSLEIINWNKLSCVRKIFRSNLDRAQRSVEKQKLFKPFYTPTASVVAADVLQFKIFPDKVELLMPYIEGITGHMFPVHAKPHPA